MQRMTLAALLAALTAATAAQADEVKFSISMPEAQVTAIQAVLDAREAYETCPNELKCTAVRKARDKAISDATGRGKVKDWIGVIQSVGTTSEGAAYLSVSVPGYDISLGTWNNGISDLTDKTLIPYGSPVYEALAEMNEGSAVWFSGQIKREKSLTEVGSIAEPDFAVRFSEVRLVKPDEGKPAEE